MKITGMLTFGLVAFALLLFWYILAAPASVRIKVDMFHKPQWEMHKIVRLENGDFLVHEGFWEVGRGARFFGRFIVISSNAGEAKGQYVYGTNGEFVGGDKSLLWFKTFGDGLHARYIEDLKLAVSKQAVGKGLPAGGWQQYRFDLNARKLLLLGTDGRYYSINEKGAVDHPVGDTAKALGSQSSEEDGSKSPSNRSITLIDNGDGRYTLQTGAHSESYLNARILFPYLEKPSSLLLLYSDKLGDGGQLRMGRIELSGAKLWVQELNACIGRRRIHNGGLKVISIFSEGSDFVVFLQEEDKKSDLYAGHICRLRSETGQVRWSKEIKDY